MPVRKFRDVASMPGPRHRSPDDPLLWRQIADLWSLSSRLCPRRFLPGVYKSRSPEEANRLRERAERRR
jgi:hypothetical protein